jgi:glycosyltransferase involved in cell wall biosynthesis
VTPLLTVCVPAYNQPEFLRDALESLCDQGLTRDDFIVAVADDASPTSLEPVIDTFRDRLPIEYHRHQTNVGHIRNYDYGFETARTPFVSFLPHDDVIAPGQLGRAVAIMQREAECVLVASLVLCQQHPGSLQMLPHGFFPMGAERARFASLYRWRRPNGWLSR